jgi:hypothetical protein
VRTVGFLPFMRDEEMTTLKFDATAGDTAISMA